MSKTIADVIRALLDLAEESPLGHETPVGVYDSAYGVTWQAGDINLDEGYDLVSIEWVGPTFDYSQMQETKRYDD